MSQFRIKKGREIITDRKKKNVKTSKICEYVDLVENRKVTLREIADTFGFTDHRSVLKKIQRSECLDYEANLTGDKHKKEYIIFHSKMVHQALKFEKINKAVSGQKRDHLVETNVSHWEKDLYPHLNMSEKFVKELDFEVTYIKYQTNPSKVLPNLDPEEPINGIIHWKFCNIEYNAWKGRLLIWTKQKSKTYKFGLDKNRYEEFIEFRDLELKRIFGYDLGWLLEPIQFDLGQDDYRYLWEGKHEERNTVSGLLIQRYKVKRLDRPQDSDQWIKRFEVRFRTKKQIRDYYHSIPYVLSLDVEHVNAVTEIIDLTKDLKNQLDFFNGVTISWLKLIEEAKFKAVIDGVNKLKGDLNQLPKSEVTDQILRSMDELSQTLDTHDMTLNDEIKDQSDFRDLLAQAIFSNSELMQRFQSSVNKTNEGIEVIHEEIENTRSDVNRLFSRPVTFLSKVKSKLRRK